MGSLDLMGPLDPVVVGCFDRVPHIPRIVRHLIGMYRPIGARIKSATYSGSSDSECHTEVCVDESSKTADHGSYAHVQTSIPVTADRDGRSVKIEPSTRYCAMEKLR